MSYAASNYASLDDVASDERADGTIDGAAEVTRLAALSPIDYERQRVASAESMGCRVSVLDNLVRKERISGGLNDGDKQGRSLALPECEPWPEAVNGEALVAELVAHVKRHVILNENQAVAVALWAMHAHALDAAEHSPRLHIASPEKRCGKSTLLRVLEPMVPRPLGAENITTSALFRSIEMARPTLLIDEADSFLSENEELRGILNAGHSRTGTIIRSVGDDFEPRQFAVWCPTVIAGIGRIPSTLEDRSITIQLRRRLRDEAVERLRSTRREHLAILGRRVARWVADHMTTLSTCDPELPNGLGDREQDNWRPLIAIADAIGGKWGEKARIAALSLRDERIDEEQSAGVMILADVWSIFQDRKVDRVSSIDLVSALITMDDRPWSEWKRGKPLTQNNLSRLLKPFGIKPKQLRFAVDTARGYDEEELREPYRRYVSSAMVHVAEAGIPSGTTEQVNENNDLDGMQDGTLVAAIPPQDSRMPLKTLEGSSVPLSNPISHWEADI